MVKYDIAVDLWWRLPLSVVNIQISKIEQPFFYFVHNK